MIRQHRRLNGHEFEETPGDSGGQGSLQLQSMGKKRVTYNLATEQQQQNTFKKIILLVRRYCLRLFKIILSKQFQLLKKTCVIFPTVCDHEMLGLFFLEGKTTDNGLLVVVQSCLTLSKPHVLWPTRILCSWDFPGKNTGVGCQPLLHGIWRTQSSHVFQPRVLNPEFQPMSPALQAYSTEPPGKPQCFIQCHIIY